MGKRSKPWGQSFSLHFCSIFLSCTTDTTSPEMAPSKRTKGDPGCLEIWALARVHCWTFCGSMRASNTSWPLARSSMVILIVLRSLFGFGFCSFACVGADAPCSLLADGVPVGGGEVAPAACLAVGSKTFFSCSKEGDVEVRGDKTRVESERLRLSYRPSDLS